MWTLAPKRPNAFQTIRIYGKDRGLTWCLQPILICLRLLGIEFPWQEQHNPFYRCLICVVNLFWLIVNVSVASYLAVDQFYEQYVFKSQLDKYFFYISSLTGLLQTAGIYAALVLATWQHGHDLVGQFHFLETHFQVGQDSYVKIRRIVIAAIAFSITAVK